MTTYIPSIFYVNKDCQATMPALYHDISGNEIPPPRTLGNGIFIIALMAMHWIMFSCLLMIILLTSDMSILVVVNLCIFMVLSMNIIYNECPITLIEQQYLGTSMLMTLSTNNSYIPMKYRCTTPIQWIFMAMMVALTKLMLLIIKYSFLEFLSS